MALADWMQPYQDRKLGELHLPGSHDAGTDEKNVELTMCGTPSNAVTQELNIIQQLIAGTRFFDLRLKTHGNQVVPHHTTAGQGAYGTIPLDTSISDAAVFCKHHSNEVVIFRISHTSSKTGAAEIVKASAGDQLCKTAGNLCKKTLAEIKAGGGGLVCIFAKSDFKKKIDQSQGIHSFAKYKSGEENKFGVSTCGCYTGTNALSNVIGNALRGQFAHNKDHSPEKHDHLWQVYWQKTYKNPFHPTGIKTGTAVKDARYRYTPGPNGTKTNGAAHGGIHAATGHMIRLMEGHAGHEGEDYNLAKKAKWYQKQRVTMRSSQPHRIALLPNIISYDFVNETVNKMIIDLNVKGMQAVQGDEESESDA